MGSEINTIRRVIRYALLLLALISLSSCASFLRPTINKPAIAYSLRENGTLISTHSPVFLIEDSTKSYNLIGTPRAEIDAQGNERVYVDSASPAFYTEMHDFKTARGSYTNLYYRVHFERSAFKLLPFNVSAGRNTGLLITVTLNKKHEALLYTIVHTCGCYLAFIPTSFMPVEAYPPGWKTEGQRVYGERLPGFLNFNKQKTTDYRVVLTLRNKTHRVKAVNVLLRAEIKKKYNLAAAPSLALEVLSNLQTSNSGSTSFFETEGRRKDYVKGSHKPWEKLFISWWTLKWRVGEDKRFSPDKTTETVFFTSLKFWNREKSDMENFPQFLRFWKWGL